MQAQQSKCAHPSCDCKVEGENQFCSTSCQTSQESSSGCACGHPGCRGAVGALSTPEAEVA